MQSKHLNEVIVFACEMPLEANILIKKQVWMDGYAVRGCGSKIKSNEFDFASLALLTFLLGAPLERI